MIDLQARPDAPISWAFVNVSGAAVLSPRRNDSREALLTGDRPRRPMSRGRGAQAQLLVISSNRRGSGGGRTAGGETLPLSRPPPIGSLRIAVSYLFRA